MIIFIDGENYINLDVETVSHVTGSASELELLKDKFNSIESSHHVASEHYDKKYLGDCVNGFGKGRGIKIFKGEDKNLYMKTSSTKDEEILWYLEGFKHFNKSQRKIFRFVWNLPTTTPLKLTGCKSLLTADRFKNADVNVRRQHIEQIPFLLKEFHGMPYPKNKKEFLEWFCDGGKGYKQGTISIHQYLRMVMIGIPLFWLKQANGKDKCRTFRNSLPRDPKCDLVLECKSLVRDVKYISNKKYTKKLKKDMRNLILAQYV